MLYNNSPRRAAGWIRESAAFAEKTPRGSGSSGARWPRGSASSARDGRYVTFREHGSGLEYLRSSREIAETGPRRGPRAVRVPGVPRFRRGARRRPRELVAPLRAARRQSGAEPRPGPPRDGARPVRDAFRDTLAALRSPEPLPAIAAYARFAEAAAAVAPGRLEPGACSLAFGRTLRALAELRPVEVARGDPRRPGPARFGAAWAALAPLGAKPRPGSRSGCSATSCGASCTAPVAPPRQRTQGRRSSRCFSRIRHRLADTPPGPRSALGARSGPALRVNTFEGVRWFDRECFELLADLLAVTAGASALATSTRPAPERRSKLRTDRPPIGSPAPWPRPGACATPRKLRDGGGTLPGSVAVAPPSRRRRCARAERAGTARKTSGTPKRR